MGRITGSASIETLVRVGIEKENGLGPESKMVVLHDFTPCVDDELEVKRGQIVHVLYQENDWVYVISENNQEGFIPHSYCAQFGSQLAGLALNVKKKLPRDIPGGLPGGQQPPGQTTTVLPPPASAGSSTNSGGRMPPQSGRFNPPPPDVVNNPSINLKNHDSDPNMTIGTSNSGGMGRGKFSIHVFKCYVKMVFIVKLEGKGNISVCVNPLRKQKCARQYFRVFQTLIVKIFFLKSTWDQAVSDFIG